MAKTTAAMLEFGLQNNVFQRSLEIYAEREAVRGSTWKEFDESDSIHHMESKMARLKSAVKIAADSAIHDDQRKRAFDEAVDSCLDLINYAAFTVRHLEGETADA